MILYTDTVGLQTGKTNGGQGEKYLVTIPVEVIKQWNEEREMLERRPVQKRDGMQMILTDFPEEDLKSLPRQAVLVIVPALPII